MAFSVGQIEATIGANMKPFQSAIENVQRMGANLTRSLTLPLAAIGGAALKTAADYETLRQSMDILNGSAEEGARNFERLKELSAGTPFQLQDLARAQNTLQGFSVEADVAFESIKQIGDIAAVTGGDIQSIAVAFGQSAAEGKLFTRDIRQFINQGVPAVRLLADSMGVAENQVFDLAEQGKISFSDLQNAFRDATSEGGMFADGMKKQSQTLAGVFSTLKDNVSLDLGELGATIAKTFNINKQVQRVTEGLKIMTRNFANMSDESQAKILKLAGMLAASGPLALALAQLAKIVVVVSKLVSTSFFKMAAPVVGFIALIDQLTKTMGQYIPQMRSAFVVGTNVAKNAVTDFMGEMGQMASDISGVTALLKELDTLLAEGSSFGGSSGGGSDPTANPLTQAIKSAKLEGLMFGHTVRQMTFAMVESSEVGKVKIAQISKALNFANSIAQDFTSSFGSGMANIVVEGEKVIDVLKNIGKLLLSSVIQKGISTLLTGGLGGSGFFGSGGGLFGKIFGGGGGKALVASSSPVASEMRAAKAFKMALDQKFQELTPEAVWVMGEKGRLGV